MLKSLGLWACCLFVLMASGCAEIKNIQLQYWPLTVYPEEKLERNHFPLDQQTDVIGQVAAIRLAEGDTLPDVARHFSLGINALMKANPAVDVWVPRSGQRIVLPLRFILPEAQRKDIVINLAAMRLFHFKQDQQDLSVSTYPIGIGTEEQPTPTGQMLVSRKAVRPTWYVPAQVAQDRLKKGDLLPPSIPPGPDNPLGEYALYLEKSYLIHGTNKPASIGLRATNGCIRLYPEDISRLYADAPVKTLVNIVDQPYLVGRRNGVVYLEAHTPPEKIHADHLKKVYARLKDFEKASAQSMDWRKVESVLAEARGIPVAVLTLQKAAAIREPEMIEVSHPAKLTGKPEPPPMKTAAWYILAASEQEEVDALRMAALINHQGPPIPARVLVRNQRYLVVAGPFTEEDVAKNVLRRLKIDLEIDGILIEPTHRQ